MAGGGIGAAVLDSQALLIHSDDLFHHYVTVVVLKFETERERESVCVCKSLRTGLGGQGLAAPANCLQT